jgi:hypothetical protein
MREGASRWLLEACPRSRRAIDMIGGVALAEDYRGQVHPVYPGKLSPATLSATSVSLETLRGTQQSLECNKARTADGI